ncbi:ImmA/IrrE family metallo-endopeptidase [Staphylococcus gallinarum]|uniref:ImmA/IrrE family metallo-endopeptidase n=1 Tax=Staphylococcus gallinarum TaxID=1293 RepID=UPI0022829CEA|nr:ImmA/IrrE family metallo-endopeptidase [Staphylococcus gallinarum]MDN6414919.1 ImmA/IrrE family metallo-endopeptidase [Staphylococcus gallinarum]
MDYVYQNSFFKAAKAVEALIETNYIDEFPLPIKEIIENDKNVQLFTFNDFCKMTDYTINELIDYGGSDEAFHIKKGNKFAIIYNENVYKKRLRFTLAHEYGHYIMQHKGVSYKQTHMHQDKNRTKLEEYEANSFASCLLFPLNVRYKYRSVLSAADAADMFDISYKAAEVALDIFDEHMENGLEDYISAFEHKQMTSYMAFLDEMLHDMVTEYNDLIYNEYGY